MRKPPIVIVIGGGLSGLTCAVRLHEEGVPVLLVESTDRLGGRALSDRFESYILDRGFQALLNAYPAAQDVLNMSALNLHPFYPGVQIWWKGKFHKFVMPFSHPIEALQSLNSPIGNFNDKRIMLKFRMRLIGETADGIAKKSEQKTTAELLREEGFSEVFIERFWRPLCGAFLLDTSLKTASKVFEFIMHCYFSGEATLPVGGMQSIAMHLADRLPKEAIRRNCKVTAIQDGIVSLSSGETLGTNAIVVATDPMEASRLLNDDTPSPPFATVTCVYYETTTPPFEKSYFILNGENEGLVQNVTLPSLASPSYAPEGHYLVAATLLKDTSDEEEQELDQMVRDDLRPWFKEQVDSWRFLKVYRVKNALATQYPEVLSQKYQMTVRPGIYRCGDYTGMALDKQRH